MSIRDTYVGRTTGRAAGAGATSLNNPDKRTACDTNDAAAGFFMALIAGELDIRLALGGVGLRGS